MKFNHFGSIILQVIAATAIYFLKRRKIFADFLFMIYNT